MENQKRFDKKDFARLEKMVYEIDQRKKRIKKIKKKLFPKSDHLEAAGGAELEP